MKPTKQEIQDLYFMDSRFKLLEIAAYLDRVDRHEGAADFRHEAFQAALHLLLDPSGENREKTRVEAVHHLFSDLSQEPLDQAGGAPAVGTANLQQRNEAS